MKILLVRFIHFGHIIKSQGAMMPNARWPSVVQEMPGREFHVTGFQRVE